MKSQRPIHVAEIERLLLFHSFRLWGRCEPKIKTGRPVSFFPGSKISLSLHWYSSFMPTRRFDAAVVFALCCVGLEFCALKGVGTWGEDAVFLY